MAPLVAVTGSTGFLGRHVVAALHGMGARVRVLVRRDPLHPLWQDIPLELVPGDLDSQPALERLVAGADAVIHLAGLIKAASRDRFFAVNTGGALRLGGAVADKAPDARFLIVSTLAAREPQLSAYAASKRAGEAMAVAAYGGTNWAVVRPPAIYGPWDRETLAIFRAALRPLVPVPSGHPGSVAMIHVTDAAAAVARLALDGPSGVVFEIADTRPQGYAWRELWQTAGSALGHSPRLWPVSPKLLKGLGLGGSLGATLLRRPVMLTAGKVREMLHPDWSVLPERLPPAMIWQPRIDLASGFAETVAWYLGNGWLRRS